MSKISEIMPSYSGEKRICRFFWTPRQTADLTVLTGDCPSEP
jgi:hypothetical protein